MPKSQAATVLRAAAPSRKRKSEASPGPVPLERQLREREAEVASLRVRLRAERMRLSLIVGSLVSGVVLTGCKGKLLLINETARRMLGLPGAGPAGPARSGSPLKHLLRRMRLPHQQGVKMGTLRLGANGHGEVRTLVVPLRDGHGLLWGALAILEEPGEGGRLNEMKSDFISRVSHELKTPLASIRAASDIIAQAKIGALNHKQEKMLRIITQETGNLVCLIEDLLDMSEIESGRISLSFRRCSLADAARASLDHFRGRYRQKQVALLDSLPPACPHVHADPGRIRQVFDNLLSNALKFTPAGGRVELRVIAEERGDRTGGRRMLQASVSDTGVGIQRRELERIFDKFHQAESLNTRAAGGAGLGLSISKFLVEAHGGEIWVESQPGAGSTFFFSLPITR